MDSGEYTAFTHSITPDDFLVPTAIPWWFGSAYDRQLGRNCLLPAGSRVYLKNILRGMVSIVLPTTPCAAHGVQIVSDRLLSPTVLHDPTTLEHLRRLHAEWDAYARQAGLTVSKRAEVFDSPQPGAASVPATPPASH
jgi:hypothetical protein